MLYFGAGFKSKQLVSSKHQLLVYVTLLETNKVRINGK